MKYPIEQYNELVNGLKKLRPFIDLETFNVHTLHYIVSQQYNPGQPHNWLYTKEGKLSRGYKLESLEGWEKLISSDFDFKLYPEGCNDTHIETAMKKAIKEFTN